MRSEFDLMSFATEPLFSGENADSSLLRKHAGLSCAVSGIPEGIDNPPTILTQYGIGDAQDKTENS